MENAKARGFTKEIYAEGGNYELSLLVKPDTDLSDCFQAYDLDQHEYLFVNGWLFMVEDVAND